MSQLRILEPEIAALYHLGIAHWRYSISSALTFRSRATTSLDPWSLHTEVSVSLIVALANPGNLALLRHGNQTPKGWEEPQELEYE